MKAAPSQQASLNELWKKGVLKKEGKTKTQPIETPSMEGGQIPVLAMPTGSNAMDVDGRSSRPPESSQACEVIPLTLHGMLTDTWICVATPDLERPAKRKASPPMSADEGGFATVSTFSYD